MEEEEIERSGISWEKPHFYLDGKIFVPKIYDAPKLESPIPEGFNAVKIAIDGKLQSDLNWKAASESAQKYIEQGLQLFWEIDLGLFGNLPNPLSNQSQYLSLGLSLEHFRDTLWKEFKGNTLGLSVYRGTADLSENFPWDEDQRKNLIEWLKVLFKDIEILRNETGISATDFESIDQHLLNTTKTGSQIRTLFCRDAAAEYLEMLTNRIPDALQLFLLMDCSRIADPLTQLHAVSRERFDRFHLAVKGGLQGLSDFTWDSGFFTSGLIASQIRVQQPLEKEKVGLCIPSIEFCRPSHDQELEMVLAELNSRGIRFRIIPETFLITEWDGLDYLIVVSKATSSQGLRKLKGFCAAGGTVVTRGEKLNLPNEIPFEKDFIAQFN